jgi:hypothetical protein
VGADGVGRHGNGAVEEPDHLGPHVGEDLVPVGQARIVELRFFGGLDVQEVADVLGLSKRTVEAEWTIVRAWLRRELSTRQD